MIPFMCYPCFKSDFNFISKTKIVRLSSRVVVSWNVIPCLHQGRGLIPTPIIFSAAIPLWKRLTVHYLVFSTIIFIRKLYFGIKLMKKDCCFHIYCDLIIYGSGRMSRPKNKLSKCWNFVIFFLNFFSLYIGWLWGFFCCRFFFLKPKG